MGTLEVTLQTDQFVRSLQQKASRFNDQMQQGAKRIGQILLERIIENTPKPGDSDESQNIEYIRTGRLVGGWGNQTAQELGINIPHASADEGSFEWIKTDQEIGFIARNEAPYAKAVEEIGAGLLVTKTWRGGRHMVENAINNTRADGTIEREINEAWRKV